MDYVKTFYDKYRDIGNYWGIPKDDVMKAINKGTNSLVREIRLNKEQPLKLPKYFADVRSNDDYVSDIVEGWTTQKMIRCWLYYRASQVDGGVIVSKNGADQDWVIVRNKVNRITSQQDLLVTASNNLTTLVEVQTCRKSDQKKYHIKTYKARTALETRGIFVFVNIPGGWYFIIDPATDLTSKVPIVANPAWGGKKCYEFTLDHINEHIGVHKMTDNIPDRLRTLLGLPDKPYYALRDGGGRFINRMKAFKTKENYI